MLNKEALMMFQSGGIGKEGLKKKILKKFPECNFAFIPYNPIETGDGFVPIVDKDDNIIINNPAIDLGDSTSDPSLFSGRMLSVETYDGSDLYLGYNVDGGEPVFPSDSGWTTDFHGWSVGAGSLFVPSSTAISLDVLDDGGFVHNVLVYSDAIFLWPNLSNYLYRGCVCMKITLVPATTSYPEMPDPEVPL